MTQKAEPTMVGEQEWAVGGRQGSKSMKSVRGWCGGGHRILGSLSHRWKQYLGGFSHSFHPHGRAFFSDPQKPFLRHETKAQRGKVKSQRHKATHSRAMESSVNPEAVLTVPSGTFLHLTTSALETGPWHLRPPSIRVRFITPTLTTFVSHTLVFCKCKSSLSLSLRGKKDMKLGRVCLWE